MALPRLREQGAEHLPLEDREARALAAKLQLFAGRVRLRVLWELADGETRVKQIANRLRMSTHEIRKQLRTLHRAGIVTTREQGELVFYRIEDPDLLGLLRSLRDYYEGEAFYPGEEIL